MRTLVKVGETLDQYMRSNGMPSNIWYCTSLGKGIYSPDSLITAENCWLKPGTGGPDLISSEFRIGYFYLGGQQSSETPKFNKTFDARRIGGARTELVFDYTAAWDVMPASASDVPLDRWNDFPHSNQQNPRIQNVLFTDGSAERRTKDSLTLGYVYIHPRRVYW